MAAWRWRCGGWFSGKLTPTHTHGAIRSFLQSVSRSFSWFSHHHQRLQRAARRCGTPTPTCYSSSPSSSPSITLRRNMPILSPSLCAFIRQCRSSIQVHQRQRSLCLITRQYSTPVWNDGQCVGGVGVCLLVKVSTVAAAADS